MNHALATPPGQAPDPLLRRTLQLALSVIGVVALVVAVYIYFQGIDRSIAIAPGLISGFAIVDEVLLRRQKIRLATDLMVIGLLVAATVSIITFGSVRTAGVILLVGAVVCAGIFASRRALLLTTLAAVGLVCILSWVEWQGLMERRSLAITASAVVTYVACLVVVAMMVYYSRRRDEQAMARLQDELEVRRRTEHERDRSLHRFMRIFHNSPTPMLAQSARDGIILDVNPAFERCYGLAREELLGRLDTPLWADPEQRAEYMAMLGRLRRTDQVPVRSLRADGSPFDALVSSELSDNPDDRLVITTLVDVTAQNAAMERLRKSEERFAKAFNFSPLKMTVTRLSDGKFVEVNQARDPVQGLGRQDLIGRTTLETGGWLSPEERQAFVQRLLADGHVSGYETRMRHVDGDIIDAKMWAELIEIDGEQCVLSCFVNTTEEKRREAQLLALTRGMAGPSGDALFQALTVHMAQAIGADMVTVGELQADGYVRTLAVWRDGGAAPNYSYAPPGSPCADTLALPGLNVIGSGLAQRYAQYPALAQSDYQAYAGQTLRDEDGSPIGLLTAFWRQPVELPNDARALLAIFASRANAELIRLRRDREIQRLNSSLEQRVRERTAELHKLNAELDSFAYSVSHDLKSPLRTIDGFTQLLEESLGERLTPSEREVFGRILAATTRMAKLIADLLALARVSQGDLQRRPVDLSALAQAILQQEQARQPQRRLRWRISPGLKAVADERLARIALENLLSNAVKYTRDQPEAQIEFSQAPAAPGQPATFVLRDNGCGFDMAHAHRLFQPFQRLHMPSAGFEGTGIGLATVRRIVERHGGSIRADAHPGEGARFEFSFGASASRPLPEKTQTP